jgi:hypothetical protein
MSAIVPEGFKSSSFEHRSLIPTAQYGLDGSKVIAGSCSGWTGPWMPAAPGDSNDSGGISCRTTRLRTKTNLSNHRWLIQEQRLTPTAPNSHPCRTFLMRLMRRNHRCPGLPTGLTPTCQGSLRFRMSLTRACSLAEDSLAEDQCEKEQS